MTTIKNNPNVAPLTTPSTSTSTAAKPATPAPATPAAKAWTGATATRSAGPAPATTTQVPVSTTPAMLNGVPAKPGDQQIVCPVLGALVAQGKVKMAPDGTVNIADLRRAFADDLGFSTTASTAAAALGMAANTPADVLHNTIHQSFNVLDLRKGMAKHQGDSSILTAGKFDEAKFQTLTSHARNGVMNEDAFAEAITANFKRDYQGLGNAAPATVGQTLAPGEFGALLATFGTKDPATGEMGIKVSDLRALFQDQKIPPHLGDKGLPDIVGMTAKLAGKSDLQLAQGAYHSVATSTGLASAGARLAEGKKEEKPSAQASMGAGKAANCPFLNGSMPMPVANDVAAQHAVK